MSGIEQPDARQAFAEALANELGIDLDEKVMAAMDRVLVALWIRGFKIVSLDDDAVIDAPVGP